MIPANGLTAAALNEKIRHLQVSAEWGTLAPDEGFHLRFRLRLAEEFIQDSLKRGEQIPIISKWPADFEDQTEMREWLLIDGPAYSFARFALTNSLYDRIEVSVLIVMFDARGSRRRALLQHLGCRS